MNNWIKLGRYTYGLALVGIATQHFLYPAFQPLVFPNWPGIPGIRIWAMLFGTALLICGFAIITSERARTLCLILGAAFLLIFLIGHIAYLFLIEPNDKIHLGLWTSALKELALSGGAFVMASSFPSETGDASKRLYILEKIRPYGRIFFSIMLILFGIDHLLYTEFVATLVPDWIPGKIFWTYFGAFALIAAGLALLINFRIRMISLLTGFMLLIWFFILHIPRAIANPKADMGNEVTSAWSALAFAGIAFVIAGIQKRKTE